MGSDLVEAFPVARDLYARASEVVGYDMTELSFSDPREHGPEIEEAARHVEGHHTARFVESRIGISTRRQNRGS